MAYQHGISSKTRLSEKTLEHGFERLNAVVSARFARSRGRFGRVQFTNAATSSIRNYGASGFYIISYL